MKSKSDKNDSARTKYVQLNTRKCTACWECLAECKNNVIGKINLPWHKHSRFTNSSECTGCYKCVNVCETGALMKIPGKKIDDNSSLGKLKLTFLINLGLLIFAVAISISGFVIQFKYHMGHNMEMETANSVLATGYYKWTDIHKISILVISILATCHFTLHWKWYKTVIIKKLVAKNKLLITTTVVFILVAISGYIPWIIDLSGGSEITRKSLIEVHDKITILLFVLLLLHLAGRRKWYMASFCKLRNKHRA